MPWMLQEKLKQYTAPMHDALEQAMYVKEIMQRTLDRSQYQKLVYINYAIHYQYEQAIFDAIDSDSAQQLDLNSRSKLGALAADLIGEVRHTENLSKGFPEIPTSAFALGAMYVLEGATLGGNVIVKQLKLNPNFDSDQSFAYYGCYGQNLIPNWQKFLAVLNALPEDQHRQALEGAAFLFDAILLKAKTLTNNHS